MSQIEQQQQAGQQVEQAADAFDIFNDNGNNTGNNNNLNVDGDIFLTDSLMLDALDCTSHLSELPDLLDLSGLLNDTKDKVDVLTPAETLVPVSIVTTQDEIQQQVNREVKSEIKTLDIKLEIKLPRKNKKRNWTETLQTVEDATNPSFWSSIESKINISFFSKLPGNLEQGLKALSDRAWCDRMNKTAEVQTGIQKFLDNVENLQALIVKSMPCPSLEINFSFKGVLAPEFEAFDVKFPFVDEVELHRAVKALTKFHEQHDLIKQEHEKFLNWVVECSQLALQEKKKKDVDDKQPRKRGRKSVMNKVKGADRSSQGIAPLAKREECALPIISEYTKQKNGMSFYFASFGMQEKKSKEDEKKKLKSVKKNKSTAKDKEIDDNINQLLLALGSTSSSLEVNAVNPNDVVIGNKDIDADDPPTDDLKSKTDDTVDDDLKKPKQGQKKARSAVLTWALGSNFKRIRWMVEHPELMKNPIDRRRLIEYFLKRVNKDCEMPHLYKSASDAFTCEMTERHYCATAKSGLTFANMTKTYSSSGNLDIKNYYTSHVLKCSKFIVFDPLREGKDGHRRQQLLTPHQVRDEFDKLKTFSYSPEELKELDQLVVNYGLEDDFNIDCDTFYQKDYPYGSDYVAEDYIDELGNKCQDIVLSSYWNEVNDGKEALKKAKKSRKSRQLKTNAKVKAKSKSKSKAKSKKDKLNLDGDDDNDNNNDGVNDDVDVDVDIKTGKKEKTDRPKVYRRNIIYCGFAHMAKEAHAKGIDWNNVLVYIMHQKSNNNNNNNNNTTTVKPIFFKRLSSIINELNISVL